MAVLRPLKVVIDNYPENQIEWFDAEINPEAPDAGTRKIPFSRELYIEQDDFMENPSKGYFRMFPGAEVRLKHAYYVKCENVVKDEHGNVIELHCTYDPDSRGGWNPNGRKVKGTLHWVSASHAVNAEVRLYSNLFNDPNPGEENEGEDFISNMNPDSLEVLKDCKVEPGLANTVPGTKYQFLRIGYFCSDQDSKEGAPVFNRTVTLKDTWAKISNK
jgi:glutaminyl-tRNA synthetase